MANVSNINEGLWTASSALKNKIRRNSSINASTITNKNNAVWQGGLQLAALRPINWPSVQRQNAEELYYIFFKIHFLY